QGLRAGGWGLGTSGIREAKHEDGAAAVEDVAGMGIGVLARCDVGHLAGVAAVEPVGEAGDTGGSDRWADAVEGEAEAERLTLKMSSQNRRVQSSRFKVQSWGGRRILLTLNVEL